MTVVKGWCLEAHGQGSPYPATLWTDTFSYGRTGPWRKFLADVGEPIRSLPTRRKQRLAAAKKWNVRLVRVEIRTVE